jgi:glutathione S-transferase
MSMLRTSMFALREDRPTSSVFGRPVDKPLGDKAKAEAAELVRIASSVVAHPRSMFAEWCIADADLALMLMRLVANQDPVPQPLVDYALAQWERPSVRRFIAHIPTQQ